MRAKKLYIRLGANEWGNELMSKVAREAFDADPTLDVVQVYEHAGWFLSYLRNGTIVGTANDRAELQKEAIEFLANVQGYESAGSITRV